MEKDFNESLEDLRHKDMRLREELAQELESDKEFYQLIYEIEKELGKIKMADEGIEKARILASVSSLFSRLEKTLRFRLSKEFISLSAEREAKELNFAQDKKSNLVEFRKKA